MGGCQTFLQGHLVIPCERQIFLRDVRQIPSSFATAFNGRSKNCAREPDRGRAWSETKVGRDLDVTQPCSWVHYVGLPCWRREVTSSSSSRLMSVLPCVRGCLTIEGLDSQP